MGGGCCPISNLMPVGEGSPHQMADDAHSFSFLQEAHVRRNGGANRGNYILHHCLQEEGAIETPIGPNI